MSETKLFLAPMEGVVDWVMRDTLTQIGGIDNCVTEFLRVTDQVYPDHVYFKNCPELKTNSKTRSGTPVFLQILGGNAEFMAMNAVKAVGLGAAGIDINFGCPAKLVNRHDGGASILKSCDRIYEIVSAVRKAVRPETPVTAKIRLGFDDASKCIDIACAAESAGANHLTVHCRTKTDGYKPPAYWEWIPKIKEKTKIKIIANGDIWNIEDFNRCREVTGCTDFMIGRGVMSDPFLFQKIKASEKQNVQVKMVWNESRHLLPAFFEASIHFKNPDFAVARTKQWLKALSLRDEQARSVFDEIKVLIKPHEFQEKLNQLC